MVAHFYAHCRSKVIIHGPPHSPPHRLILLQQITLLIRSPLHRLILLQHITLLIRSPLHRLILLQHITLLICSPFTADYPSCFIHSICCVYADLLVFKPRTSLNIHSSTRSRYHSTTTFKLKIPEKKPRRDLVLEEPEMSCKILLFCFVFYIVYLLRLCDIILFCVCFVYI